MDDFIISEKAGPFFAKFTLSRFFPTAESMKKQSEGFSKNFNRVTNSNIIQKGLSAQSSYNSQIPKTEKQKVAERWGTEST